MNIYQNLLQEKNQNNLITSLCQNYNQNYVLQDLIVPNKQINNPFHINCQISKKKICYCEYGYEKFMPQKYLKQFQDAQQILTYENKNIQQEDIKKAIEEVQYIKKKQILNQKIRNIQEIKDFYKILPKFQFLFEEKNQNQLEIFGKCLQCKYEGEFIFYQKIDSYVKNQQTLYCEKCVKVMGINTFELWNPQYKYQYLDKFNKKKRKLILLEEKQEKVNKTKQLKQSQLHKMKYYIKIKDVQYLLEIFELRR